MPHKALVTVPETAPILEKELWRPIPLQIEWLQCKELGREICGWAEAERAYAEAGIPYPGQFQVRTQGRPVTEVIGELNKRLKALGIQPQEYGWSASKKSEWSQSGNRITSDTVLTDGVGERFTPEELDAIRASKIEVPPCR